MTCWVNTPAATPLKEAMVLMAQSFAYRHPLVDGKATGGSRRPNRLQQCAIPKQNIAAQVLLSELGRARFSLTALYKSLLVYWHKCRIYCSTAALVLRWAWPPTSATNLRSGPGMHSPHHPQATLDDLLAHCPAPDYPTTAKSLPRAELRAMYETGQGSVKARAVYERQR